MATTPPIPPNGRAYDGMMHPMGFRFRKSIKLFPGVRINLSKSGVSTSIGKPGATVNISERGTRGTVGIPGTGISYSEQLTKPGQPASGGFSVAVMVLLVVVFFVAFAFAS